MSFPRYRTHYVVFSSILTDLQGIGIRRNGRVKVICYSGAEVISWMKENGFRLKRVRLPKATRVTLHDEIFRVFSNGPEHEMLIKLRWGWR